MEKEKRTIKSRNPNYDFLRIVCCFFIVILHVSGVYVNVVPETIEKYGYSIDFNYPAVACIYNSISRFAVPCFLFLSGAFLLEQKNVEPVAFYKKNLKKIVLPTIVFSILYLIYNILCCFLGNEVDISEIGNCIKKTLLGEPFYHMWYMYMLIMVYIMVPFVLMIKERLNEKAFEILTLVWFVCSVLSMSTSTHMFSYDIASAFCYMSYLPVGYILKNKISRKNNLIGILLIGIALTLELMCGYMEYSEIMAGVPSVEWKFGWVAPYNPVILIASLLVFSGFSYFDIASKAWISKLSSKTFYIYLIHAGVWSVIERVLNILGRKVQMIEKMQKFEGLGVVILSLDCRYAIPVFSIVVFLISYIAIVFYMKCVKRD